MPQLGESVVEGTIGRWLVKEGEHVEKDQPLVEILTDKADSELPAPVGGVVTRMLASVDDIVAVGETICEIDEAATGTAASASEPKAKSATDESSNNRNSSTETTASSPGAGQGTPASQAAAQSNIAATPSARRLARERGIDLQDVRSNQISRDDVLKATQPGKSARQPTPAQPAQRPSAFRLPPYKEKPGDEIIPFSRRRRIIADHMVYSKHTSPDVVTFAECDLHAVTKLRNAHKHEYKKEGIGLTFLAFATAATARALNEFPELNARVLEDAYVKLGEINIGIAVDTPEGLVVPVIRNTNELSLRGIARSIGDLATRARDGNLTPDDLANKTFAVSNPGRKGNLVGGAIISQPNVGILRLGTIKKRVVVVEKDSEDLMAIHPVMHMALTYDHRVVDGVHANGFLYRVAEILEQADFEP